ncbi:hypothetical protein DMENIID0001_167310 [Sergentomyia squamirostris]
MEILKILIVALHFLVLSTGATPVNLPNKQTNNSGKVKPTKPLDPARKAYLQAKADAIMRGSGESGIVIEPKFILS